MSLLEKMRIQGIRSFSPEVAQQIEFSCPVTLILGPNGTGKTTIIECLKYATTGTLPPGSKTGGSFVYDPKLDNESEVKAKVTLKITDIRGSQLIVSRALCASQKEKAKQVTMKTLDASIRRVLADGTTTSLSSKCGDLDHEMVSSLGVSKAVLENVIFCHQEESNWPLSEGKMVKERFDDLFASSRYVKALEVIRKTRVDRGVQIKVFEASLEHLQKRRDEAKEKRDEKEELEVRLQHAIQKRTELIDRFKPDMDKLSLYNRKYEEMCAVQSKIKLLESRQVDLKSMIDNLHGNIKEDYSGSDSELQRTISDSEKRLDELKKAKNQCERRLASEMDRFQQLDSKKAKLNVDKGKCEAEAKSEKEKLSERNDQMKKFGDELSIHVPLGIISEYDVTDFNSELESKIRAVSDELKRVKSEYETKEKAAQKEMDDILSESSRLQQSIKTRQESIVKHERDLKGIKQKLGSNSRRPDEVELELRNLKDRLSNDTSQLAIKKLDQQIDQQKKERIILNKKLKELDQEICHLQKSASDKTEYDIMKKKKHVTEEKFKTMKNRRQEELEQLFSGEIPTSRLRPQFDKKLKELHETVSQKQKQIHKIQMESAEIDMSIKNKNEELNKLQKTIRDSEMEISALCCDVDFDRSLEKLQLRKKQTEDERSSIQGNLVTFRKFLERLEKTNPPCPLCHRHFEEESDVMDLVAELSEKIASGPQDLQRKERDLLELNRKYDEMIQLRPTFDRITAIREKDIPKIEEEIAMLKKDAIKFRDRLDDEVMTRDVLEADEKMALAMQGDIAVMEKTENEITEMTRELVKRERSLGACANDKSVESIQEEKESIHKTIENLDTLMEEENKEKDDLKEAVQKLRSEENKLTELSLSLQNLSRVEDELKRLREDTIRDGERQGPIAAKLAEAKAHRTRVGQERSSKEDIIKEKISTLEDKKRILDTLNRDVERFRAKKIGERLCQLEEAMEENSRTTQDLSQQLDTIKEGINKATKDIANHEIRQRELTDIRQLRDRTKELGCVCEDLDSQAQLLGGIQILGIDVDSLRAKEREYVSKRNSIEETRTRLSSQIEMLTKDLKDKYANSEAEYTQKVYELKTNKLASRDLDKYYKALDKAIISYHNQKMEEINKIIKELWRNTYRGNDIDYIEIRSDEDETNSSKQRRSYNYRVAMVKGTTWLDMRGRCSAGQKVLASLVIRLALAEVFCLHCGVFALDEPTTNLDRDNIESLAFALVEIIKTRSRQRNFQLMVITHDEDFVELLGRSDQVDHFFKISRNDRGTSVITRLRMDDQFH